MPARTLLRPAPPVATLLILILAGCSGRTDLSTRPTVERDPSFSSTQVGAARAATQPGFYPLTVGNRWTYQQEYVAQLIPNEGEPPPPDRVLTNVYRSIVDAVEFNGRAYLVEQEAFGPDGVPGGASLMRQDASGLYEWSPVRAPAESQARVAPRITVPAGRTPTERAAYEQAARRLEERVAMVAVATGRGAGSLAGIRPLGAEPWELTRLRYPLAPKLRWPITGGQPFRLEAEVIGAENLRLPPGTLRGYRIRLRFDGLAPSDFVYVWYGPSGFLQLTAHLEVNAVDLSGAVIGRYVIDQREWLTEVTLVSPVANAPFWPARPLK